MPSRRLLVPMAALCLLHSAGPASRAADPPVPEGRWLGSLAAGANQLRLYIEIVRDKEGRLSGTLTSLDQGEVRLALEVAQRDGQWHFEARQVAARFSGSLNDEGQLAGRWSQGGFTLPLVLKRTDGPPRPNRPQTPQPPFPYASQEVQFNNQAAGIALAGTLTLPEGEKPVPGVVLVSGSGPQDRDETLFGHKPFLVLADFLTRRGMAVLRYDDRGVGRSEGDFSQATTADLATDARAAVDFLAAHHRIDPRRIAVVGHSEGGVIAPLVASGEGVAAIVLLAGSTVTGDEILFLQSEKLLALAGFDAAALDEHRRRQAQVFAAVKAGAGDDELDELVARQLRAQRAAPADKAAFEALVAQTRRSVTSPWMRHFLSYDPLPALGAVRCPVLALYAENDVQVAPQQNAPPARQALADHPDATVSVLPGLNHLFQTCPTGAVSQYAKLEETIAPAALTTIAGWLSGRLGLAAP